MWHKWQQIKVWFSEKPVQLKQIAWQTQPVQILDSKGSTKMYFCWGVHLVRTWPGEKVEFGEINFLSIGATLAGGKANGKAPCINQHHSSFSDLALFDDQLILTRVWEPEIQIWSGKLKKAKPGNHDYGRRISKTKDQDQGSRTQMAIKDLYLSLLA